MNREFGYKFMEGKVKGNVAVYHMKLTDLITRVKVPGAFTSGYQVYQKENIEQAFIQGGEAEISWHLLKNLNLIGSLCYTYGQNKTSNEPLRRIPPIFGRSQIELT